MSNLPFGPIASIGIFLVAAMVAIYRGDSASLAGLMVLGGIVVNSISSHYGRIDLAKKTQVVEKKLDNNTEITKIIGEETIGMADNVSEKVAEKVADKVAEKVPTFTAEHLRIITDNTERVTRHAKANTEHIAELKKVLAECTADKVASRVVEYASVVANELLNSAEKKAARVVEKAEEAAAGVMNKAEGAANQLLVTAKEATTHPL